jgi:16S rRNA (adenine1518-N6/adenine1519-N6)-dimethyltransferase
VAGRSAGVKAKKALGQHFLTDLGIARRIAEAVGAGATGATGTETPTVLEIGGGMGVLTQFLLERESRGELNLWGVEIDRESIAYMRERFPEFAPRLLEGDFLKMDLAEKFPQGVKVVGNFPYNISSQIFFKVLEHRDLVPEVVGMVQREVAQRIAEPPGSRTYGITSVLLQAWYDIEYLFTVSEGVFSPPPKVKSAVIRLKRNSTTQLGCDEELFTRVVKAAFSQRRKMLKNPLRAIFGASHTGPGDVFGGEEHPLFTQRAEKLSVEQFVELTNWISNQINR